MMVGSYLSNPNQSGSGQVDKRQEQLEERVESEQSFPPFLYLVSCYDLHLAVPSQDGAFFGA